MNKASDWKVSKWPFVSAWVILLGAAGFVVYKAAHPISQAEIGIVVGCVVLGALFGCLPFVLDYRATGKLIEANAVGAVSEKIEDLKHFAAQVAGATDQWARVQEATQGGAEKTAVAAREIADRMSAEIREFNEFQAKLDDTEKSALRLEVGKLRRVEGDWLQVVARMLDHVFALHSAAARSGQPELSAQISQFQNACRDAARRVGLLLFEAAPNAPFETERHRAQGVETVPDGAVVAETLAPGMTFQGRLIRPALVQLETPVPATAETAAAANEPPLETPEA
jgi:molecular chaperone GrpE (heat shock protein)